MEGKALGGRFSIQQEIGRGHFSVVYKAVDSTTLKEVAVKVLKPSIEDSDVMRETRVLTALSHLTCIPRLVDSGVFEGKYYIVQELLDRDVYSVQKKCNPLPVAIVLSVTHAIISALREIHESGYLHLDLKPDNIGLKRLSTGYQFYLMDFGLASKYKIATEHYKLRLTTVVQGHPLFLSVNTLKGLRPSRRDDLESLMYTAAFMGNGTLPWWTHGDGSFEGSSENMVESREQPSPREICGCLPSQFALILSLIKELAFEAKPAYSHYQTLLEQAAAQLSISLTDCRLWDKLIKRPRKIPLSSETRSISPEMAPRSLKRHNAIPPTLDHSMQLSTDDTVPVEEIPSKGRTEPTVTPKLRKHIDECRQLRRS